LIAIVLAIVASLGAGVWAERRWGPEASRASRRSLLAVLYVVLPPTTFFNIAAAEIDVGSGVGVVLGWLALAGSVLVAWFVAARVLRLSRPAVGSVLVCVLIANTGYLGYPVVAVLEGLDALSVAVVYDILVGSAALLVGAFTVGAAFGERAGEGARERTIAFFARNPPLYAAILGLVAPDALAPELAVDVSRIAIIAVLPIGFFAVGVALAEESEHGTFAGIPRRRSPQVTGRWSLVAPVVLAVGARMVLAPLLLLALAAPLIDLPETYLLLAAMPCGINTMIVTHTYGLDLRISATAVAWSTAIAVLALLPLSLVA
jgi:malate permease and related proteins